MTVVRLKKRNQRHEASLRAHLRKLGFEDIEAYQDWCGNNGFSRELHKSNKDRGSELQMSLTTGPNWSDFPVAARATARHFVRVTGSDEQVLEQVLSGHLSPRHKVSRKYRPLLRALPRLQGPRFEEYVAVFRDLIGACEQRETTFHESPRDIRREFKGCTFAEGLAMVVRLRECWVRPLVDWKIDSRNQTYAFLSLIDHLFVRYEVPKFLYHCWFNEDGRVAVYELDIFVHLAAGNSIRTANTGLPCSKKAAHYFTQAPENVSLKEAFRWAQVRAQGGTPSLANTINSTFLGQQYSDPDFWNSVIHWFIQHPNLNKRYVLSIVNYLNNQRFGVGNFYRIIRYVHGRERQEERREPAAQPGLSMKGRSATTLLRDVIRWRTEMEAYGKDTRYIWSSSNIRPLEYEDAHGTIWSIRELLGNGALFHEGRRMQHCVSGYSQSCAAGISTIWSMSRNDNGNPSQVLTIEVNPKRRVILQARGRNNREPSETEFEVLRQWFRRADLTLESI